MLRPPPRTPRAYTRIPYTTLCRSQNSYEFRALGTPGEVKTVSYLISKFTEAVLQPGNNGNWTQDVPLVEITAKNVSPLSFTGGKAPMSLKYGTDFVAATYRVQPQISDRKRGV